MRRFHFIAIAVLVTAIACALVFSGCSRGGDTRPKLVYWDDWSAPNYVGAEELHQLVDHYRQKHQELKVEYQCTYENGQETTKILTSMAADCPPDVYMLDRFLVASFVARNGLTDLTQFVKDSGINPDDYYKSAWDETVYKGKVWAIPFGIGSRMLYYRPADLKEVGLDPNHPPATWAELEDYSRKLMKKDATGRITRIGFVPGIGNDFIYMYGWLNGGEFMRGNTITCDDPKIVEALSWMKRFRDIYGSRAVSNFSQGLNQAAFGQGQISMMITGDWEIHNIAKYSPKCEYSVAPPPAPAGRQSLSWTGGFSFVIPAKAKNKKAAMEFIKFMTSPEAQKYMFDKVGLFPASKKVAMSLEVSDPKQKAFLDLMDRSRNRPVTPIARQYWDAMLKAQDQVLAVGSDPKVVLGKAAKELQKEQDKYK